MKPLIIFLFIINCGFALLFACGKLAQRIDPALYEYGSRWSNATAFCLFGFLITWLLFVFLGIVHVAILECRPDSKRDEIPALTSLSMYCSTCRYQLIGLTDKRCPECGRPFDPDDPSTFRRSLQRAYWARFRPYLWTWLAISTVIIICLLRSLIRFVMP
jgi:hypothetical protein